MGSQGKVKTCACKNETEQEKLSRIEEVIEEYGSSEGNLIQILHMAQGIYGCLPLSVQQFIAEKLGYRCPGSAESYPSTLFHNRAER